MTGALHPPPTTHHSNRAFKKERDEGVDEFHIRWFAGVIKGLDPGLAEGFKGAIEEAADELGIHAEPGETAQQLLYRVRAKSRSDAKTRAALNLSKIFPGAAVRRRCARVGVQPGLCLSVWVL